MAPLRGVVRYFRPKHASGLAVQARGGVKCLPAVPTSLTGSAFHTPLSWLSVIMVVLASRAEAAAAGATVRPTSSPATARTPVSRSRKSLT
jgi:hypothetical protein